MVAIRSWFFGFIQGKLVPWSLFFCLFEMYWTWRIIISFLLLWSFTLTLAKNCMVVLLPQIERSSALHDEKTSYFHWNVMQNKDRDLRTHFHKLFFGCSKAQIFVVCDHFERICTFWHCWWSTVELCINWRRQDTWKKPISFSLVK